MTPRFHHGDGCRNISKPRHDTAHGIQLFHCFTKLCPSLLLCGKSVKHIKTLQECFLWHNKHIFLRCLNNLCFKSLQLCNRNSNSAHVLSASRNWPTCCRKFQKTFVDALFEYRINPLALWRFIILLGLIALNYLVCFNKVYFLKIQDERAGIDQSVWSLV